MRDGFAADVDGMAGYSSSGAAGQVGAPEPQPPQHGNLFVKGLPPGERLGAASDDRMFFESVTETPDLRLQGSPFRRTISRLQRPLARFTSVPVTVQLPSCCSELCGRLALRVDSVRGVIAIDGSNSAWTALVGWCRRCKTAWTVPAPVACG